MQWTLAKAGEGGEMTLLRQAFLIHSTKEEHKIKNEREELFDKVDTPTHQQMFSRVDRSCMSSATVNGGWKLEDDATANASLNVHEHFFTYPFLHFRR